MSHTPYDENDTYPRLHPHREDQWVYYKSDYASMEKRVELASPPGSLRLVLCTIEMDIAAACRRQKGLVVALNRGSTDSTLHILFSLVALWKRQK